MSHFITVKKKATYVVRFTNGEERNFVAINQFQADRIADGIAKAHGWTVATIGKK